MGLIYAQCILGNFHYGIIHKVQFFMLACQCLYYEGIWNNYVDIQQKNMQVRINSSRAVSTILIYLKLHSSRWSPFPVMQIWFGVLFTSRIAVFYGLSSIFQSSQFVIKMLSSICLNIGTVKLKNNEHVDDFLVVIWPLRFKTRWQTMDEIQETCEQK